MLVSSSMTTENLERLLNNFKNANPSMNAVELKPFKPLFNIEKYFSIFYGNYMTSCRVVLTEEGHNIAKAHHIQETYMDKGQLYSNNVPYHVLKILVEEALKKRSQTATLE